MIRIASFSVVVILLVVVLEACGGRTNDAVPAHILSENTFTNLLTDVRLLEGAYSIEHQRVDSSTHAVGAYYNLLLERYQLTHEKYLESYTYYASHPELMLRIETKVSEKLDSMQRAGASN